MLNPNYPGFIQKYWFPVDPWSAVCAGVGDLYVRLSGDYQDWETNAIHPEYMEWHIETSHNKVNWIRH